MRHKIDLNKARSQKIFRLSDKFFGTDPQGKELGFTNDYMIIDHKPFYPISGECHFSRVARTQWEDTILKMKAGGLNIIATYIFWNHHEEIEGQFDFEGNKDLRAFVTLCQKHQMYVILRIGPFDHGEVRNGGLPDWLYGKPFDVRSSQPGFLNCVRLLYRAIASQIKGLLYQDGGPVIAAQIDNEYMHSAAPWEMTTGISNEWVHGGSDGDDYMLALKSIAIEEGIVTPFYTCTGWGGAATPHEEMMTLWGGYAFWPWMFYGNPGYVHPATPEYIYRDYHNNAVPKTYNFEPTYLPEDMPYACCEMGGGMINFYNYRFQLPYESVDAMANIKMAGGCNFLGYYMYRGGTNPHGRKCDYLNEHQVPKISYDYQAPIGEFGQIRPSFKRLRPLHLFAKHFAGELCQMTTMLADDQKDMDPYNNQDLRYALRTDGKGGFLFLNNYQDHLELTDKRNECMEITAGDQQILIEDLSIAAGESAILPINLDLDGVKLLYATAQLISRIDCGDRITYIFFEPEGMKARFAFADEAIYEPKVGKGYAFKKQADGKTIEFIVLTREESLNYTEIETKDGIIACVSEQTAIFDGKALRLEYTDQNKRILEPEVCGASRYILNVPELNKAAKETLLQINYSGDIGSLFDRTGYLLEDNFSNGAVWETGLQTLGIHEGDKLTLYITPKKDQVVVDVSSTMAGRKEVALDEQFYLGEVALVETHETIIPFETGDEFMEMLKRNHIYVLSAFGNE